MGGGLLSSFSFREQISDEFGWSVRVGTCLHLAARGCLSYQNDTRFALARSRRNAKPTTLVQVLSNFDWIEPQQTPDIHMGQARAAEVVNVSHRAAQERRHLINGPEVLYGAGCFSGDFHAHGTASTGTDRQCVECRVNPTNPMHHR